MDPVFGKLRFKEHKEIYVLGAPREFREHIDRMKEITTVRSSPNCKRKYGFVLIFVRDRKDVERNAAKGAEKIEDDGILWFAYPKKSSPNYKSDISRDSGWDPLGELGYEPVSQVSIDDDWSALRFRKADNIRTMKRDPGMALSSRGRERTS